MSLPYDLALRLKNAGFPYKPTRLHFDGSIETPPTLDELIDACPKIYEQIDYFLGELTLSWRKDIWHIGYHHADGWYEGAEGEGSTPLIAVANLYLALNEKV